jgi:hypothetical protein
MPRARANRGRRPRKSAPRRPGTAGPCHPGLAVDRPPLNDDSARNNAPMHLLTPRSGELVSLVKPLCDDPGCTGCAGLVGLDSAHLVELATVAERPDTGTTELVSAAEGFLKRTGWVDKDPEVIAEYALDMAAYTPRSPAGTRRGPRSERPTTATPTSGSSPALIGATVTPGPRSRLVNY